MNMALAFIAAMGAAGLAVAIAELLDTSFGTGEEIERRLGMAHLGSIPDLTSMGTTEQPHIYITTRPLSAFAEAFRSLRTSLLQGWRGRPPKTVAIASALPGEGKTIAAVCLAKSAAQAGDKVAVIDCDLRRRRLSTSLGIKPTVGLLEVLAGKAELDATLVYDSATGVAILPLTNEEVTPEDVFGSEAMRNLLDELSARFDLVVLDTAPILALADTRTLVAQVDAIVLLTRWRRTPQKAVEHAIRLLRGAEDRIAGVMLSQVNMSQQKRQGYGDPAYYAGAYEKYYMG
jgi:succinoglycan biosynthesis transport protein ExoP